jgi:hypothetical protein
MTETFDPSQLAALAESFDPSAVAETADYKSGRGFKLREPGEYTNPYRTIISSEKNDDGTISIGLELTGGLVDEAGTASDTRFPIRAYLSSRPFVPEAGKGHTTSLADYFRAVGVNPTGVPLAELLPILNDTLSIPARAYFTWTDRSVKNEATGKWESLKLKAKDFNTSGNPKAPVYASTITRDGVEIKAKLKFSRFVAPRG